MGTSGHVDLGTSESYNKSNVAVDVGLMKTVTEVGDGAASGDTMQESNSSDHDWTSDAETKSVVDRRMNRDDDESQQQQQQQQPSTTWWQTVVLSASSVTVLVLVAAIAVVGVWKLCRSSTPATGRLTQSFFSE